MNPRFGPIPQALTATLVLALLASGLQLPLLDLDEGAFTEATREMLENREFLFITLNGEPRPDKPILIYWLQAAAVSLLGQKEWVWRLPSVIASLFWMLAVWRFARERMPEELALQASLLTLTSAGVSIISHAATADALFNLWLTLTAFDMARYFEEGDRARARRVWLWMGLGFLTKGPAAVVLPALPAVWHAWRERRLALLWQALRLPSGWLLFLATALPWYVLVWWLHGPELVLEFLLDHNLGRFTRTMESHGGYLWFYLLALPLVLLPASGLLLELFSRRTVLLQQAWVRFGLRWLAVSFVVFSLSSTQLPHYMLYGLPLLFPMLASLGEKTQAWKHPLPVLLVAAFPAALWLGLALASPALIRDLPPKSHEAWLFSADPDLFFLQWPWLALALGLTLLLLWWLRHRPLQGVIAAGVVHVLVLHQVILPVITRLQQEPVRQAALIARAAGASVVAWKTYMPSFSVYRQAVTPYRPPEAGEWVFTRKAVLPEFYRQTSPQAWEPVYDEGAYVLLRPAERP